MSVALAGGFYPLYHQGSPTIHSICKNFCMDLLKIIEKEMATHYSVLAGIILWTEGDWWALIQGVRKSQT